MSLRGWRSRCRPHSGQWQGLCAHVGRGPGRSVLAVLTTEAATTACPPCTHTPRHPTARWNRSPRSSAPLTSVRCSSASSSSRDVLPRDCWCDGDPGHPHQCPKVPAGPHCIGLHKVRTAQAGPALIATIPLTGAISHLSSLISAHLVFH